MIFDIVIIGGGVAGLFCGLAAIKNKPKAKVLIIEKGAKPAAKLLLSGNGRCNIGNTVINNDSYNDYCFAKNVIDLACRGNYKAMLRTFGIETREIGSKMNTDSWLYPITEQSKTVLEILLEQLRFFGVSVIYGAECVDIIPHKLDENDDNSAETYDIIYEKTNEKNSKKKEIAKNINDIIYNNIEENNSVFRANKVIIATGTTAACGEDSLHLFQKLGIKTKPFTPCLCGFFVNKKEIKYLDGQRVKAKITLVENGLPIKSEDGEIIFKADSVNGICIMGLSRYASENAIRDGKSKLICDIAPYFEEKELENIFYSRLTGNVSTSLYNEKCSLNNSKMTNNSKQFYNFNNLYLGIIPKSLFDNIIEKGISSSNVQDYAAYLAHSIKNYCVSPISKFTAKDAQIMRGGVELFEVDGNTMKLKKYKNICAVGEITDIDGACGGYNIMYAVCSAVLAAKFK